MDTLSTALDHVPVPGTEVISIVTDYVDVDVPAIAGDLTDAATDGLVAAAGATAGASRTVWSSARRRPVITVVLLGAVVAAVVAWRLRARSGEADQLDLSDAA